VEYSDPIDFDGLSIKTWRLVYVGMKIEPITSGLRMVHII
jgi:hypothetical protein